MKKNISKLFYIISFIPFVIVLFNMVKSYFYGYKVVMMMGLDIPLSYGLKAVYNYLWVTFSFTVFGVVTVPLFIICIIYQIVYLKKIRKNVKRGKI